MNGTYNIILKSQLGPKSGTIFLKATRRRLWCCLSILGNENILVGTHDKDTFSLKGKFTTALGPVKCQLSGRLLGPHNFEAIGGEPGKTIEVAESVKAAEDMGAGGILGGSIHGESNVGGIPGANVAGDIHRANSAGDLRGESLLEANITIDGREYPISGTLA